MAGGAMNETSALKGGRLHQIAIQNKLPTVTFVQSVKCNFLLYQYENDKLIIIIPIFK